MANGVPRSHGIVWHDALRPSYGMPSLARVAPPAQPLTRHYGYGAARTAVKVLIGDREPLVVPAASEHLAAERPAQSQSREQLAYASTSYAWRCQCVCMVAHVAQCTVCVLCVWRRIANGWHGDAAQLQAAAILMLHLYSYRSAAVVSVACAARPRR